MTTISIDLAGARIAFAGDRNAIADAALVALASNGGSLVDPAAETPGVLILSCRLLPSGAADDRQLIEAAEMHANAMAAGSGGRILFLLPAVAAMPMRRHPEFSAEAAALLTQVRTLAMRFGPKVLVNAVGFGLVEGEEGTMVSGDVAMLSHTPLARAATLDEAVAAVLFLCDPLNSYTTGQMLSVDGGWNAGYGRNF